MNIYDSRFITYDDEKSNKVLLKIPEEWWSRLYEYHWASLFAREDDICLDAACGVLHPFKFFLASKCREVYACDIGNLERHNVSNEMTYYFNYDDINLGMSYYDKINFSNYNLTSLGYEDDKFDKVYCISTLEHLNALDIPNAISEIYRVLKPEGFLILTVDYPDVKLDSLIELLLNNEFKFVGEVSTIKPKNAIYSPLFGGLNCYRILVQK